MLKSDNPPPLTLAVQSGRRSFSSARACWARLPRKGKIFACVVLLPTVAVFLYYLLWASPMYVSQTRFAIRSADSSGGGLDIASALLRSSSSTGADAHIVVEYIQSLDIIHDIDKELGVDLHFSDKGHDVFSRLTNNPTQDEQLRYWKWAVIPALDQDTGIITLETKAYSPEMAQKIAAAVLARSEALVNTMNLRAREDAVSLAQSEVQRAEARVRKAQEAMRNFRDAHTLLDPRVTAAGLQGVVTELEGEAVKLRAQLAEAQSFMRSSAPATKALQTRLKAAEPPPASGRNSGKQQHPGGRGAGRQRVRHRLPERRAAGTPEQRGAVQRVSAPGLHPPAGVGGSLAGRELSAPVRVGVHRADGTAGKPEIQQ
mgnify:CR=1 FL=1